MSAAEFFSMDGRAFYVWASFGAFALLLGIEVVLLRLRTRRVRAEVREEIAARVLRGV